MVASGPLLGAVPIDKLGREEGCVLVRGRDESNILHDADGHEGCLTRQPRTQ